jgi:hypothetical protein
MQIVVALMGRSFVARSTGARYRGPRRAHCQIRARFEAATAGSSAGHPRGGSALVIDGGSPNARRKFALRWLWLLNPTSTARLARSS